MHIAGVPLSVIAAQYTKKMFNMYLSQVDGERWRGYVYSIATDKRHLQSIRLFNAAGFLRDKYTRVWQDLFSERRKIHKRRSFVLGVVECLPECVAVYVGIDTALKILKGFATVGDYTLYTGLVTQMWMAMYMLSNSITMIYDNKLKVENYRLLSNIEKRIADNRTRTLNSIDSIEF